MAKDLHHRAPCDGSSSSSGSGSGAGLPTDNARRADAERRIQEHRDNAPLAWKLFAFLCTLLLGFGSHYSAHVLTALKGALKADLRINNAQFGVLQAAVSLVNTVVPLLGGRFIDVFGATNGAMVCCSLIMLGDALVSVSAHLRSFALMVAGRLLYGFGSTVVVGLQYTLLAHWFRGSAFALCVGIQIATSRLASFLAVAATLPIKNATGWYGYPIWVATGLCFASWVVCVVYLVGMRRFYAQVLVENNPEEMRRIRHKMSFALRDVYAFPPSFWCIAWSSFALGSTWTAFLHISPDLIKHQFQFDETFAAFNASVGQVMPIVLGPFVGAFMDRRGQRPAILVLSTAVLIVSFLLLSGTKWPPVVALVLFSLSLSFGPVAMISSIGLLVGPHTLGTAMGIYKAMTNIGNLLLDPFVGYLQDVTHSYAAPMVALTVAAGGSAAIAVTLVVLDRRHFKLLSVGAERRKQVLERLETNADALLHEVAASSPEMEDHDKRSSNNDVESPADAEPLHVPTATPVGPPPPIYSPWWGRCMVFGMLAMLVLGWVVFIFLFQYT